jgi:hypothetical protein
MVEYMPDHMPESRREMAENIRRALLNAALQAYEDAGMSGLCAEGRWEAAISALRSHDLGTVTPLDSEQSRPSSGGNAH